MITQNQEILRRLNIWQQVLNDLQLIAQIFQERKNNKQENYQNFVDNCELLVDIWSKPNYLNLHKEGEEKEQFGFFSSYSLRQMVQKEFNQLCTNL
ncbi:unnamed protein product [Paramecium octaurelia]|uniref:Uncharacterized protein n=1 Tax=Paramecium octaurelia TaxID=43137 RepID=A0A8S1TVW3_PAROT|nr:unnamed protein product [Paramecium octaurelia]